MIRLAISVEGRTEEEFVKGVLAGHLRTAEVEPTPILIGIARRAGRGGDVSVENLASDMARLYLDPGFHAVTSLVDLYGFRGPEDAKTVDESEERVCRAILEKLPDAPDPRRIIPYVQQYEFEGLLFSDVDAFRVIGASAGSLQALRTIRGQFPTPEDINDHPDTAPSKRIAGVMQRYETRGYGKIRDGFLIAGETGLDAIRWECRRFDEWVSRLETLSMAVRRTSARRT